MGVVRTGWHLAKRFLGSLRPGPPLPADERWARSQLGSGELAVWESMNNPDRRHAVTVARAVAAQLGPEATTPVLAAALLHDSGKVVSGLRTPGRVAATVVWLVTDPARAHRWADSRLPVVRRFGQYRLHPELGADLLEAAGSDPLPVAWAREHHRPPHRWTVPHELATVLKACDDD